MERSVHVNLLDRLLPGERDSVGEASASACFWGPLAKWPGAQLPCKEDCAHGGTVQGHGTACKDTESAQGAPLDLAVGLGPEQEEPGAWAGQDKDDKESSACTLLGHFQSTQSALCAQARLGPQAERRGQGPLFPS